MFELVIEDRGVEYVAFTAEKEREVELVRQRHVRLPDRRPSLHPRGQAREKSQEVKTLPTF